MTTWMNTKMRRILLICAFVTVCVVSFCDAIYVKKDGPASATSLNVVEQKLQDALVKELAMPSKEGGLKDNFNTTVTMDKSHHLKVEAQANITTQTETHIVVTTGNPAVSTECETRRERARCARTRERESALRQVWRERERTPPHRTF